MNTSTRQMFLTFHGLGDPPGSADADEAPCWVPVDWFEAILAAAPVGGPIEVTFDDGNVSDVDVALPRLLDAGRTAAFFVLAGQLETPGFLSLDGVKRLEQSGMTVGSHGLHHRDWRRVDGSELAAEVDGSRQVLSNVVGRPVDLVAIPFGSYDRRVLRAARRTYKRVFTSDGGPSRAAGWLVPRTTVRTDRPLAHWLALVSDGVPPRPDPIRRLRQTVKRCR
jgi:peptidoglycan/xylan/chitin deacetylase (PgdA/CDA1 family)